MADALPLVNALPAEERPQTVGTIIGLAYHYLEESAATALLEAFKMANALEDLIGEGIARGRQEGLEQGQAIGMLEGERQALRMVVQARFQVVPEALERRIAAANQDEIDRLLKRASVAASVDEVS